METLIDEVAQKIAMSCSGWSVIECEMSERFQCAEDLQHELSPTVRKVVHSV